ncbi:MAG: PaaI family thioesterase [Hyphomicrobiales bacterium]|nr:PaaI family thioesterase [Hyphomicrobiales bacterium]
MSEMMDGVRAEAGFGLSDPAVIREMSGLEYLRGILEGRFPAPTISRAMNMRMLEIEEGKVAFCGTPGPDYCNPMGTVHGGYMATLLDSALGCCIHSTCAPGYASTSIDLKVNFVRPVFPHTGRLIARAHVVHPGRQIATTEARLTDENGKLYAHGSQACSIFKIPT